MMATMQKYFQYVAVLCCGIPSVTLLGTVEDWDARPGAVRLDSPWKWSPRSGPHARLGTARFCEMSHTLPEIALVLIIHD